MKTSMFKILVGVGNMLNIFNAKSKANFENFTILTHFQTKKDTVCTL